ncbi:MAG: orotidine-5'-phosphate decarboxylase [Egibacteraceae bacterium]
MGVNPLIVALDTADLGELEWLAETLAPHVAYLKVGLQAFAAHGPTAVNVAARHAPVFLDLKLHDIPHTVAAAAAAAARLEVAMLTVHASGGPAMIAAAAKAAPDVVILGVTVLTSLDDDALLGVGQRPVSEQVRRLAGLAVHAGARGVVCAPVDVEAVRAAAGPDALLVVPGIRPHGADPGDQARVASPASAAKAGADYLVVGRPIITSPDPAAAARTILAEVHGG